MALRIITQNETYEIATEGASFELKRLSPDIEAAFFDRLETAKTHADKVKASLELLDRALVGWQGIEGPDGQLAFSKDRIRDLDWLLIATLAVRAATGGAAPDPLTWAISRHSTSSRNGSEPIPDSPVTSAERSP